MTLATLSTPPATVRKKRILVIDDEERLAQSLASLLRGAGYDVQSATTGQQGLGLLGDQRFDLIITDLRMEGVDGFDIMQYIAAHCPQSALIVITGHASTQSAIEALHQRASDYITKPFDFDVLRASIERVFAQQEADRLRRDLVNMLTHDIKVPLTNIRGFAQILVGEDGELHADAPRFARLIALNTQKLLLMLDNYLTNARLEEGRLDVNRGPVDLPELVLESLQLLYYEFEKKNLNVDVHLDEAVPGELEVDETLLSRAISNLLSNAAKYTPRGHDVRLELVRTEHGNIRLTVANTGADLKPGEEATLFERYQRASTSTGEDGTGLGLHIVKSITEHHGGRAWCELRNGEIAFHLELPG